MVIEKYEGKGETMQLEDPELDDIIRRNKERTGMTAMMAETSVEVRRISKKRKENGHHPDGTIWEGSHLKVPGVPHATINLNRHFLELTCRICCVVCSR